MSKEYDFTAECQVMDDLLPLYIDTITSEESNRMVEEHIKRCKTCQEKLDAMSKRNIAPSDDYMKDIKKLQKYKSFLREHFGVAIGLTFFVAVVVIILIEDYFTVDVTDLISPVWHYSLTASILLPLTAFGTSIIIGASTNRIKWICPLLYGGVGFLLSLFLYHYADISSFFSILIPSLAGLGIGLLIRLRLKGGTANED